ncbi:MAG: hypothetical protein ACR2LX_15855 [Jatrophihabitans sp.]
MPWIWRLEKPDGSEVPAGGAAPANPQHASQSDAETWLGENWRELADADVAQVRLFDGRTLVYGPMPLAEQ